MSEDEFKFMNARRIAARVTVEEAAWLLGCQSHDIQGLVRARLLKPLGNPPANGKKLYRTKELLALADDAAWLHKMTNAIHKRWHQNGITRKASELSAGEAAA